MLEQLINDITRAEPAELIKEVLKRRAAITLTKHERKAIVDMLKTYVSKGQKPKAAAAMSIGLICVPDFLDSCRRAGALRASTYDFLVDTAADVVEFAKAGAPLIPLHVDEVHYLDTISILYRCARAARSSYVSIRAALRNDRTRFLKEALVYLDVLCMKGYQPAPATHSRENGFFSFEELASGFSYLLYLYQDTVGTDTHNVAIDPSKILGMHTDALLRAAALVDAFREFEILVDSFGYRTDFLAEEGVFGLRGPDDQFERCLNLGYIIERSQSAVKVQEILDNPNDALSLTSVGTRLFKSIGAKLTKLEQEPIPRYKISFPDDPRIREAVQTTAMYLEEGVELSFLSKDLLIPADDLMNIRAWPDRDITLFDLLKVHRLFNLLRIYAATFLEPMLAKEPALTLQSLVPCWPLDALKQVLSIAVEPSKTEPIIEALTWSVKDDRVKVADVQYQPLIHIGGARLVPMNILGHSNIVRNTLALSQFRYYHEGTNDPLGRLLQETLKSSTPFVAAGIPYRASGRGSAGEIDVAAYLDGVIFLFECKNSLHPCSAFELRTSYDYIRKGARQLEGAVRVIREDAHFRTILASRLGLSEGPLPDVPIVTAIVMSNRMFTGYRLQGHPIRGLFELLQFIRRGEVAVAGRTVKLWRGEALTVADLRSYLEEDLAHQVLLDCLEEVDRTYEFGAYSLRRPIYKLRIARLAEHYGIQMGDGE